MHIAYISMSFIYITYICFKTREIDHVLTHDICTLYVYDMYIITHTPENAPTHIYTSYVYTMYIFTHAPEIKKYSQRKADT